MNITKPVNITKMQKEFFQHETALVQSKSIGKDTKIWAFTNILSGSKIGVDCNICDHVFIENDVIIGDRVTVKCGVQIWDGIRLEDDVFIGPNVTFTNDPFPRSKKYLGKFPETIVKTGASIGANSTILPGIIIGQNSMIGAGSVVTRSVPPHAIVMGNPARITGYVNTDKVELEPKGTSHDNNNLLELDVAGTKLIRTPYISDLRGDLVAFEFEKILPFSPKRIFYVFDVPSREIRGEHAHKKCSQFLVCLKGSVNCLVDNGNQRQEIILNNPNVGVLMSPMVWGGQYKYSNDAVLAVIASHEYDHSDYIRSYDEFLKLKMTITK